MEWGREGGGGGRGRRRRGEAAVVVKVHMLGGSDERMNACYDTPLGVWGLGFGAEKRRVRVLVNSWRHVGVCGWGIMFYAGWEVGRWDAGGGLSAASVGRSRSRVLCTDLVQRGMCFG